MLDHRLSIYGNSNSNKRYGNSNKDLTTPQKKTIGNMATLLPMNYSNGSAPLTPSKHLSLRFSAHLSSKKTRRWLDADAVKLPRYHSLQLQPLSKSKTVPISATMATGYVNCPYMYMHELDWLLLVRVSVWLLAEKIKGKEKDDEKLAPPISTP
jgi:hypothetical protein